MDKNLPEIRISIVIVNYNVKEYVTQALFSIQRALHNISHEIFVVDNASVDGSVAYLRERFPGIQLIINKTNVGFGKANNQGLEKAKGEFIVLINPDTVVQEDTFTRLLTFFEETPDAGVATCKIINPDGSFSVDCRHSIPTPSIAFWKVTGLSKLFPKSRLFGKYNLTYLDADKTYQVPAISGSFMMFRKTVLDKTGYFDDQFFMYCEDIDLCHRINLSGEKIYYVPTTQIIHYKGESTKKDNLDYIITFNRSLYQFFRKYYAPSSIFLFRWLVVIGIFLRGIFIYLKNFARNYFPLILDTIILNGIILLAFVIRMSFKNGFLWENFFQQYWVINFIATILFWGISFYMDIYPAHRFSIQSITKANIISFILLASLTFFLKQFAFSRMVVVLSFVASPILMLLWRAAFRNTFRADKTVMGRDLLTKPTVLVGDGDDVKVLYEKLQARKEVDYELAGWVSTNDDLVELNSAERKYLGSLKNLKEIIRIHRIRQVIFSAQSISYEQILKTMSNVTNPMVEYKMVPSNLEVIIGKSHIERLDDYPFLDIDYSIGRRFNRFLKRVIDIGLSTVVLVVTFPFSLPSRLLLRKNLEPFVFYNEKQQQVTTWRVREKTEHHWMNYIFLLWQVFLGNLSLVGSPLGYNGQKQHNISEYWYKPGITGLVQLNRDKIYAEDDAEKYHLFYLKNQSTLLDLEIVLKSVWRAVFRAIPG